MRIRSIDIRNFRGFEEKHVDFDGKLSVVIGNNTAGKTTLLKALQVGLGAYLQSLSLLPGGKPYRKNFSKYDVYKPFVEEKRNYIPNPDSSRVIVHANCLETQYEYDHLVAENWKHISWSRQFVNQSYTSHTRGEAGQLMDYADMLTGRRSSKTENAIFPIVLSFGAQRTEDAQYKKVGKVNERMSREEKAYKMALHDKVDFEGAMDWLAHYDKDIKDKKEYDGTREAFFEALATAIPALSEIDFDRGEIEAVVTVTGRKPERHHFSYMSDGLQSMINIVSEIAHRCVELNGFLGKDAIKKTPGVVIIDELDLYLHPHWQRHILRDLMNAFPEVQFIVSTHSPFIVQSLQENQLISFDDDVITTGEPYKESVEDIAELRMGMHQELRAKRYMEMLQKAERYYELIKNKDYDRASEMKEELDAIESEYSDDPAYVALLRAERKSQQ